jgi:hypothetical protein
VDTSKQWLNDT